MNAIQRAQWLVSGDIEPLVSGTLRNGVLLGVGFIVAGVIAQQVRPVADLGPNPRAADLQILLLTDIRRYGSVGLWARPLLDMGMAVILVTPYVRLFLSFWYFSCVVRRWPQAVFTGINLLILTLVFFTTLV